MGAIVLWWGASGARAASRSAGELRAQQARVQRARRQQRHDAARTVGQARRARLHGRRSLACTHTHVSRRSARVTPAGNHLTPLKEGRVVDPQSGSLKDMTRDLIKFANCHQNAIDIVNGAVSRTVEDVDSHGGDLGVGGRARVAAGVGGRGVLHQQVRRGHGALLRHHGHAAARRVVRDHLLGEHRPSAGARSAGAGRALAAHLVLVVPEDVGGRLGAELDEAREVDRAADVDVQVGPAQDARRRHCAHATIINTRPSAGDTRQ
ncbi:hypothetical protein EVAR_19604_1 [Eumeta japonica]|uniref:Uncharacterized protein n=1 Tax=Eumeta variegata TaxID=151549 RepID=A0A4C1UF53_EUMVA|nr:hypothetical protein EVAR_19604_1 [Eumeta japonica]